MPLVFLIVFLVTAFLLCKPLMRRLIASVDIDSTPSSQIVEPGEPFAISVQAQNKSCLPMPFLSISESLPSEIAVGQVEPRTQVKPASECFLFRQPQLVHNLWLMPRRSSILTAKVTLPSRGRYLFGKVHVEIGDLLGLDSLDKEIAGCREVVVLPKRLDANKELAMLGKFIGDMSVRRWILEDPVLTTGYTDYTGREPMRYIDWPRSLRNGQMTVRQFDHTTELAVTVMLNTMRPADGDLDSVERCFSLTRGVCEFLEKSRIRYSFITNASGTGDLLIRRSLAEGLGRQHLMTILEGLGRASNAYAIPFEKLLSGIHNWAERDRLHILITPGMTSQWQDALQAARLGGTGLLILDSSRTVQS